MVQRPQDTVPGTPAGEARAAVVSSLSCNDVELIAEHQIPPETTLVSDEWKAFMTFGESFARHESVNHSSGEYVCGSVHINSTEGFGSRVQRTITGVFHHISLKHADLYFNEIGFRWSQRVVTGTSTRKNHKGRKITRTLWSRVSPALQLPNVFRTSVGRQMRRTPDGGIIIKSEIALFG